MVYGRQITIVGWGYKPTNTALAGPTLWEVTGVEAQ